MKIISEILEFIDKIGGFPVLYAMLACIIFLIFAYKMAFDLNPNVLTNEDIIRMGDNSKKSSNSEKTPSRRTSSILRQARSLRRNRIRH